MKNGRSLDTGSPHEIARVVIHDGETTGSHQEAMAVNYCLAPSRRRFLKTTVSGRMSTSRMEWPKVSNRMFRRDE